MRCLDGLKILSRRRSSTVTCNPFFNCVNKMLQHWRISLVFFSVSLSAQWWTKITVLIFHINKQLSVQSQHFKCDWQHKKSVIRLYDVFFFFLAKMAWIFCIRDVEQKEKNNGNWVNSKSLLNLFAQCDCKPIAKSVRIENQRPSTE